MMNRMTRGATRVEAAMAGASRERAWQRDPPSCGLYSS